MVPGRILRQARFYSVNTVSKAQTAASIGPALAMVALQMMLSEVSGLVRTNLAVTSQVLTAIRKDQWAELTGLVAAIDRATLRRALRRLLRWWRPRKAMRARRSAFAQRWSSSAARFSSRST